MSDIKITPGQLTGTVSAPASKSHAHRLLIAAALSDRPCAINNIGSSKDISCSINCLNELGAGISAEDGSAQITPVVKKDGYIPRLDCGESGSTLRFLAPVAAALYDESAFCGSGRLGSRPVGELLAALEENGVKASAKSVPFSLSGRLKAGRYGITGRVTSQYITGLLFALPLLDEDSIIELSTPLSSAGYVALTMSVLKDFGIQIEKTGGGFFVKGGQSYRSKPVFTAEGDWSGAAFMLCAGAINGSVGIEGLNISSLQRDRDILNILWDYGAAMRNSQGIVAARAKERRAFVKDMDQIPDLVPPAAALAAFADGETVLKNCKRLRLKESDRLAEIVNALGRFGIEAFAENDDLHIIGGSPIGAKLSGSDDHRIVMMEAVIACAAKGESIIEGASAVAKSYPSFFEDLRSIGGSADVI